jgi:hypothetical protein
MFASDGRAAFKRAGAEGMEAAVLGPAAEELAVEAEMAAEVRAVLELAVVVDTRVETAHHARYLFGSCRNLVYSGTGYG